MSYCIVVKGTTSYTDVWDFYWLCTLTHTLGMVLPTVVCIDHRMAPQCLQEIKACSIFVNVLCKSCMYALNKDVIVGKENYI